MEALELSTSSIEHKWRRIQSRLRAELGEDVFTSWFGRVELEGYDGRVVQVSVPTKFLRNWLQSHYSDRLLACCGTELSGANRLEFRVRQPHLAAIEKMKAVPVAKDAASPRPQPTAAASVPFRIVPQLTRDGRTGLDGFEGSPLDPRYTFQSFVVGAPNRLAHAASLQVAESTPEQPLRYNPLYVHARVGMGKTHLLHAIAWEVKNRNPAAKVLYLTAER